jgi:oligogalacturonide transport system substrate-binding protein
MKNLITTTALAAMTLGTAARAEDLRMSWWGGDARHVATQAALEACGAKYGHTISPEFTGFDGYLEKLTTQMAGGTEADIIQVNWPWLPLFTKDGTGFADLRSLAPLDLTQWSDDQLAAGSMNGVLQGLPVSTTGRVFFFNKTTFDKAGLDLPANWNDLIAAAATLREKLGEDYRPFNAVKETAQLIITLWIVQKTGKDLVDPATNRVAWTAEELAAGFEFYQSLVDAGVVDSAQDEAAAGNVNLFEKPEWSNGEIAGSYEWDSTYGKYADPLAEGQVLVPVPMLVADGASTDGVYRKPSMVFSISKNSEHQEAAAQILNCLMNEPEGIAALGDTRGIPASKVAAEWLIGQGKVGAEVAAAHEIVMASSGPTVSPFNENPEVRGLFLDTLEEFAYGQIDAMTAAETFIEGANETLAKFD